MKKKTCAFSVLLVFVAALIATVLSVPTGVADANSAQRYFEGIDSSGAIVTMENCPVVVDKEDLDFTSTIKAKATRKVSMNSLEAFARPILFAIRAKTPSIWTLCFHTDIRMRTNPTKTIAL